MSRSRRAGSVRRITLIPVLAATAAACATFDVFADDPLPRGIIRKNGLELDVRSLGRQLADDAALYGKVLPPEFVSPLSAPAAVPQLQFRRGNVQVNGASLDNIQTFPGSRPFLLFTQSETSMAAYGRNIVSVYNTSANQVIRQSGSTLFAEQQFFSGFSVSNDGGLTWTSGFMPPLPGSKFTYGDGVIDVDRQGNFYFAGLGEDANAKATIQINKSADGGRTWSDAIVVQQDDDGDKEWIAIGRDPVYGNRDNIYVTWTSFQESRSDLRFARSIDGGTTWVSKTIYNPVADPVQEGDTFIQFSNPYVDPLTGVLYVPFLHFGTTHPDFIRILKSDDAGETFQFLEFNVPGASDPRLLPAVAAGQRIDCGTGGGFRLSIHAGPDVGGGRSGLPRYVYATRLVTQPAFAARNGVLYLAWSSSTSQHFNDPAAGSNILFIRSDDGGSTWTQAIQVNPNVATDLHRVLPSLAIGNDPNDVHVAYYTQHSDRTIDVDMANSRDRGASFEENRTLRLTPSPFALPPTNIPLASASDPFLTTNFDRTIKPCYNLGEYMSVKVVQGTTYAVWGDNRNSVTEPVNALDPLSGQTHPQPDVFFQGVRAQ